LAKDVFFAIHGAEYVARNTALDTGVERLPDNQLNPI
jgi:hypothetical protein